MKIKIILAVGFIFLLSFLIESCKKESNKNNNESKISTYNSTESHNIGQNCISCHQQGGSGEGWFNIAATVYDSLQTSTYPNCTVKLYTGVHGTGTLKYTVKVDGKGNFYSTENIDFGTGLYPAVMSSNGTKFMSSSISTGNCTNCHGNTTSKIWAN